MRGTRQAGIKLLDDGSYRAVVYADSSVELKRELLNRVPEDMAVFIKACAARTGKLGRVAAKWRE